MFSIWEYRYSDGICFGTVYALQNSTPNISTPNILSCSRMRSKGSGFTLGVRGLRVCSLDVAFTFATVRTVRNRSREGHLAVPMVSSAEGILFGGFKRLVASFRVASVALRDIQMSDVFCNVWKVVLCGRRNTFATFSEDALQFSWQAQNFGRVHCHFAWQARHFRRVVWRVFCKSHWQGWHFVRCAENWRRPRTKHRFWGSKFKGSYENS